MTKMGQRPGGDESAGRRLALQIGEQLLARGESLAVAESCTGGWIAKLLTDLPGSSRWFERGFVVYSHAAKAELLGVDVELMVRNGTVCEEVAVAEAQGCLARSHAQWALSTTGIAGPGGGSVEKPVGLVWIACAGASTLAAVRHQFAGDRDAVRWQATVASLRELLACMA